MPHLAVRACALLLSIGILPAAVAGDGAGPPADRPNIVLVLVDDLGWQDCSVPLWRAPTQGNARYRTTHLERLAGQGMRFTNGYAAAPVCTPTRTSLQTGQDPGRTGITYWTLHRDRDTSRERDDIAAPPWRVNGLSADDTTLARLLRDSGYRTIHVGKAHFGAHDTSGADPRALGFDVNIAGHASGAPGSYRGTEHFSVAGREGKLGSRTTVWDVPGLEAYHGEEIFLTEALAREAIAALEDAVTDGIPFFLDFCPYAVHTPIQAHRSKLASYPDLEGPEAAYATMVETVDDALGALLDALDRLGVADDTVVVYTSDNGGLSAVARGGTPHTHNAPLRSGKGSAYEGGTRVPWVVRWRGVTAAGSVSATPVISQDLFPTLLAAAGVALPENTPVDGVDLASLLRGARGPTVYRPLVWHQPHQWGARGPGIEPFTSIRLGDEKLIFFHAGPRFELYDLSDDIGETRDLAPERPERVRVLAGALDAWFASTGASLSIDRATGEPIAAPGAAAAAWTARSSSPRLRVRSVSSEQPPGDRAAHAVDGDPSTIWHTRWQGESPRHPHQITLDTGAVRALAGVIYTARPNRGNGTVAAYRIATSEDGQRWTVAAEGSFDWDDASPRERTVRFDAPVRARYLRFGALSERNDGPWASAAEIAVIPELSADE